MSVATRRAEAVELEFCELGIASQLASALATDLMLCHPLSRREGVRAVVRRLERKGVDREAAEAAAAMLLALERYESGRSYADVLAELRVAGVTATPALTAALDAARVHRSLRSQRSPEPFGALPTRAPALGALALAVASMLSALALALGSL